MVAPDFSPVCANIGYYFRRKIIKYLLLLLLLMGCGEKRRYTVIELYNNTYNEVEIYNVLEFIQNVSVHDLSVKPKIDPYDRAAISEEVINKIHGGKANLYCGHRVTLAMMILEQIGLEMRYVNLGSSKLDAYMLGHVLLEAKVDGSWILVDPDFGVLYKKDGEALSLRGVVELGGDFLPCTRDKCGRPLAQVNYDDQLFGFGWYHALDFFIVNRDVFNINKTYTFMGTRGDFYEYSKGNYEILK